MYVYVYTHARVSLICSYAIHDAVHEIRGLLRNGPSEPEAYLHALWNFKSNFTTHLIFALIPRARKETDFLSFIIPTVH